MKKIKVGVNDSESVQLSTDEHGSFSLMVCGYPQNANEDDGVECVSVLLNYKEVCEFIVKADLLIDGKIK
jgi:hypothetical protein